MVGEGEGGTHSAFCAGADSVTGQREHGHRQPQISVLSSFASLRLHQGVSDQGSLPVNSSRSGTKTGGHRGGECSGGSVQEGERLLGLRAIY